MRLSTNASPNLPRTIYAPGPVRTERVEKTMRSEREESRPYSQPSQSAEPYDDEPEPSPDGERYRRVRKRRARRTSPLIFAFLALIVLVPLGLVGWSIFSGGGLLSKNHSEAAAPTKPDAALSGVAAQMRMAADYTADKDYVKAENTYRLILKTEPSNRDAIKELASVLFRQQKYDEAAAVLKTLPPE
jgi:tetratricopeptide (TPR) repeat protein